MMHRGILAVLCSGVVLASAPLAQAQEATSPNLPEHIETGEAMPPPKLKKKKKERSREIAASVSSEKPAPAIEQAATPEESTTSAPPPEKKHRVKRRAPPAVQPEAASFSTPTSLSLSAAQAMAVSAPLPEYPYQAKHANVTGSGVCVMIVDTASGKVTNAMMAQSTGNAILDKVTTETFRRWRFKPGSVSQVRVPISYEWMEFACSGGNVQCPGHQRSQLRRRPDHVITNDVCSWVGSIETTPGDQRCATGNGRASEASCPSRPWAPAGCYTRLPRSGGLPVVGLDGFGVGASHCRNHGHARGKRGCLRRARDSRSTQGYWSQYSIAIPLRTRNPNRDVRDAGWRPAKYGGKALIVARLSYERLCLLLWSRRLRSRIYLFSSCRKSASLPYGKHATLYWPRRDRGHRLVRAWLQP